jgi:hypothetical protein
MNQIIGIIDCYLGPSWIGAIVLAATEQSCRTRKGGHAGVERKPVRRDQPDRRN